MDSAELTDAVAIGLAALAIVVQAALAALLALALAALASERARGWLRELRATLAGAGLWIAWAIAAVATAGSLFFSEYSDFVPCRLCWFQRIAMYPLAVLLLIAALRRDRRGGALYALPFPVLGALVAIYHVYIEHNPEAESASCKVAAPCSVRWIEELGYVTLPVLALTAFAAIMSLLLMARARADA
ncbi:MAG TPA: disulfide bond formation protein B [Thermoleophilaceae bacterium]